MINASKLPLTLAREGAPMVVVGLAVGRDEQKRLSEIGIFPGGEIALVRGSADGPLVVALGKARLALGQEISRKIFVASIAES